MSKKTWGGKGFQKFLGLESNIFEIKGSRGPKELRVYGPRSKTEVGGTPKIWRLFAGC